MPEFSLEIDVSDDSNVEANRSIGASASQTPSLSTTSTELARGPQIILELPRFVTASLAALFQYVLQLSVQSGNAISHLTREVMAENSRSDDLLDELGAGTKRAIDNVEKIEKSHDQIKNDLSKISKRVEQIKARRRRWEERG